MYQFWKKKFISVYVATKKSIYPNVDLIFPLILAFENGPYFTTLSLLMSHTNWLLKFVNAYKLKARLPDFRPHMTDSRRISSDIN